MTTALIVLALLGQSPAPEVKRLTFDGLQKARPIWSSDGKYLTFARHERGGAHIWQYIMPADDPKAARRVTDRKVPDFHAAFAPDGKRLAIVLVAQSGTQGDANLATVEVKAEAFEAADVFKGDHLSHQDWPSWSPDGTRIAFSSTHEGNQEIYAANADGSNLVRLTQSPGHDAHPSWSPDGTAIAFATDRWGGLEIATVKPDGTGLTRLTNSRGIDDFPAFSPDGQRIAFVSHRDGNPDVYVANADGSSLANVSIHPGRDTHPAWTPDGAGLTFVSDRDGGVDLYTVAVPREGVRP